MEIVYHRNEYESIYLIYVSLVKGETIKIFNYGNCKRDFTYIDDIVEGVVRVMKKAPDKKNGEDGLPIPPYAIYNIGNQNPENLLDFVQILSEELVRAKVLPEDYDFEAHKELVPMQPFGFVQLKDIMYWGQTP